MKHEKAPTAPQFEGVLTISYMPLFWKFKAFGQFWPTSVGRNCQKSHLYAKTFHMSLFPGLYDHSLQRYSLDKEVFVKHEQAPTAPKLEGVWVFVDLKYIFYENRYFWPIWQLPVGCFLTEMVKKHIYGLRPFIWAYNQVSKTFRSKVLARTSSNLGKPLFWANLANLTTSAGVVFDRNGQNAHLRTKTFHLSL